MVIESLYGQARGKAELIERMHPEVVGLQHGFGHWALGRTAAMERARTRPLLRVHAGGVELVADQAQLVRAG